MQRSKLGVWLLCLLLSLSLLASCGGGDKETEKGGTFSSKGSAAAGSAFDRGSQVEESAVSAEDFYGCWEYEGLDIWMCIYDDGTYERFWGIDASSETGTYSIEGNQLVLEYGLSYSLEEPGRIVDSDGDPMVPSELPDIAWNAQGDGRGDLITEEPAVNFEDFFGCWEYNEYDAWIYIYGDGTYEEFWDGNDAPQTGTYSMDGDRLVLDSGRALTLDGSGGLVDSDGDTLFASQWPAVPSSTHSEYDIVTESDFYGCWEDTSGSTRVWLTIFGDGTYVWLWDDGYGSAGECWMEGDELILESGTRFILSGDGGIVGDDGSVLYPGQVPDELSGLLDYRYR